MNTTVEKIPTLYECVLEQVTRMYFATFGEEKSTPIFDRFKQLQKVPGHRKFPIMGLTLETNFEYDTKELEQLLGFIEERIQGEGFEVEYTPINRRLHCKREGTIIGVASITTGRIRRDEYQVCIKTELYWKN